MKVPVLSQNDFLDYLKGHGCKVVEDMYWEEFNRIILVKDNSSFPLQTTKKYFFPTVCKVCETLGIPSPEDHQKCLDQIKKYHKRKNKGDK